MKGMGYHDPATGHVVDPAGLTEYGRYRAQYLNSERKTTGGGLPIIELALGAVFFVIGGVVALAGMLAFWAIKTAWRRFQPPGYEWVFREGRHANRMTLFELIFLIAFSPIILPITLVVIAQEKLKSAWQTLTAQHRRAIVLAVLAVTTVAAMLYSGAASAEINENNVLDQIVNQYRNNVAAWSGPIINAATWMFWMLALLEFTWTGITLALKGADYVEVVSEFIVRVLFIGFFAALLQFGPQWAQAIINSLSDIASQASQAAGGAGNSSPGDIFDVGLELAGRITDSISFWDGADALGLIIGSIIIIICFALIAAMLIVTMVETYIVVQAAVILLGFGPTRWTKDYAVRYLMYAFATGMKWFVLLLIVGLGEALLNQWIANYENNDTQVLLIIGASVVLLALVKTLPDMMQSILTGISYGTGQSGVAATAQTVTTTTMASAAASRAISGMTGGVRAGVAAGQLARAQGAQGFSGVAAGMAQNFMSEAGSQIKDRLAKGRYTGPTSGMGHRMTDEMKAKIAALKSNSISK